MGHGLAQYVGMVGIVLPHKHVHSVPVAASVTQMRIVFIGMVILVVVRRSVRVLLFGACGDLIQRIHVSWLMELGTPVI